MDWTWDDNKAEANRTKHGVSFRLTLRVFDDPFCRVTDDPYSGEQRWRPMGRPDPGGRGTFVGGSPLARTGRTQPYYQRPRGNIARKGSL